MNTISIFNGPNADHTIYLASIMLATQKMVSEPQRLGQYYVVTSDRGLPSFLPVYWQSLPRFTDHVARSDRDLAVSYTKGLVHLYHLVTDHVAADEPMKAAEKSVALYRAMDDSSDFFEVASRRGSIGSAAAIHFDFLVNTLTDEVESVLA